MWLIRAHYDGKVIVPDEPVTLPVDTPLHLKLVEAEEANGNPDEATIRMRLQKLALVSGCLSAPPPSPDSLRRENLYDERL